MSTVVRHGKVISPRRQKLIAAYRKRHEYLFSKPQYFPNGTAVWTSSKFAPEWTKAERAQFRKWQADFMVRFDE